MTEKTISPFEAMQIQPTSDVGPFEQGDIAVQIKPDGKVVPMSFGIDTRRLRILEQADFSEADKLNHEQGRRLLALTMAASNPTIMDFLFSVLDNPAVAEEMAKLARRH